MSNVIRIVAAVIDTERLTMYQEDGTTLVLNQGDPRVRLILEKAAPVLSTGGVAEVCLDEFNEYHRFQEASQGKISFFSIAKRKLKNLFGKPEPKEDYQPAKSQTLGLVPLTKEEKEAQKVAEMKSAINEIMAHATPISSPEFIEVNEKNQEEQTVIAVVNERIIPDVHKIKPQIARANHLGSPTGVEAFLSRLANIIDKRNHSVEDLLRFMEKGDLPIAEDGSIIIYKVLKRVQDKEYFVDCHTGRVPQKVGSYVCMDEKLVDPNRSNECSNGLHVARRGYLSSFPGDVCVIAKVAPEDVIAVPSYDANKMRVCGYHILFEVGAVDYQKLKNNQAITDNTEAKRMIGKAITGEHVGKLEEVRITQQKGGGVQITPLVNTAQKKKESLALNEITKDSPEAIALSEKEVATPVNPKAFIEEPKAAQEEATPPSRQQIAQAFYVTLTTASTELERKAAAQSLRNYKKKTKLGWHALGLKDSVAAEISKLLN